MASTDIFNRKASVPEWVAKWWEFDQAFSAKVMAGGWRNMTKEQAIYGSIQGLLAVAVAACGAVSKDQKSTELPSMGQPTIGLITEASAGSDLLLNQQLAGVKTLSGRADCLPQLVAVDGGNLGAETVGLCQVNTKDGQGTEVIVRKQKGGDQQTIKQMLTARTSPETLYFEYGSGDQKETLFKYDMASGGTEWVLPDGKTIEFKKGQSPFEEMIGKILDPGNVAQAAEATQLYDPTKPATVTATPDGKLTITQPAPTETPILTAPPIDTATSPPPTKDVPRGTPPPPPFTPPEASPVIDPPPPATLIIPDVARTPPGIVFNPSPGGELIDQGEGNWHISSYNIDPCPKYLSGGDILPEAGIQYVVPTGYEYLIGQMGFVCQIHTLPDGRVSVSKSVYIYVSELPTPSP